MPTVYSYVLQAPSRNILEWSMCNIWSIWTDIWRNWKCCRSCIGNGCCDTLLEFRSRKIKKCDVCHWLMATQIILWNHKCNHCRSLCVSLINQKTFGGYVSIYCAITCNKLNIIQRFLTTESITRWHLVHYYEFNEHESDSMMPLLTCYPTKSLLFLILSVVEVNWMTFKSCKNHEAHCLVGIIHG